MTDRPLNIAHRGARAFAPENTLEAFRKAAELGASMVECDVQLTADHQPIVIHDDTLQRCSNVRDLFGDRSDYRVQSFNLDEIRSLDAGSWFVHELERSREARQPFLQSAANDELNRYITPHERARYASGRVRHPILVEALEQCRDLGMRVNVELKGSHDSASGAELPVPDRLITQVVRCVNELEMGDRVLISSFDHVSLRHVKQLEPTLMTGVLTSKPIGDPLAYCRNLDAAAYHPGCGRGFDAVGFDTDEFRLTGRLPAEPFRSLRAAGIAVYVWTENDPTRMRLLIDAGASGIFTDYPNRMAEVEG